jgi:cbb3-type cytochrome oxidase subunit 3
VESIDQISNKKGKREYTIREFRFCFVLTFFLFFMWIYLKWILRTNRKHNVGVGSAKSLIVVGVNTDTQ